MLTADVSAAGTTATLTDGVNSGFSPTDKFLTNSSDTVNLGAFDVTTAIGKQIMIADASTTDNDLVKFIVSANGAVTATALNKIKLSGIESVEITNDGLVNSGATQTLTLGSNYKGISNLTLKGVGTTVDLTDAGGANGLNITGTHATDTVVVSGGKSVDFSKGTFSSIEIIDISKASEVNKATVAQGTDLTKVMGSGASGAGNADVFTIKKSKVASKFNQALNFFHEKSFKNFERNLVEICFYYLIFYFLIQSRNKFFGGNLFTSGFLDYFQAQVIPVSATHRERFCCFVYQQFSDRRVCICVGVR